MRRLLLVAFFLEVGLALLVLPWSAFWDRNYFALSLPAVHDFITNNFVRGAVSGVGIVNIAAGVMDLVSILMARHIDPPVTSLHQTRVSEE